MVKQLIVISILLSVLNVYCAVPLDDSVNFKHLESVELEQVRQIGGMDVDGEDNLLIFHRGSRRWTKDSFIGNEFNPSYGPIKENVLEVVDLNSLKTVAAVGANQFYMPHGVAVDHDGYVWLTDVAMHQVFKFDPADMEKPLLSLGTKLESGSDSAHFCKPTGIAVSRRTGDIFVSDGYCNQRVVQFDKEGKFVREFKDAENPMIVVHSVALIGDLVCAASREDGRIVCFNINSGEVEKVITDPDMKKVYAIKYDSKNKVIQAATGENGGFTATLITFDASTVNFGKLVKVWDPSHIDLSGAHDLAISEDGAKVFVGQLNGEIDEFDFKRSK